MNSERKKNMAIDEIIFFPFWFIITYMIFHIALDKSLSSKANTANTFPCLS